MKKGMFAYDGTIYETAGKICDGMFLGFLWILTSVPLITIGASTTALYYAVHKGLIGQREYVYRAYWKAFRENFKQSTALWLLTVLVSFLLHLNVGILDALTDSYIGLFFMVLYALCSALIIAFFIYSGAALSRFAMPTGWFIRLGLYMTMRYFLVTLGILVIFALAAFLAWLFPYSFFFLPVPVAMLHHSLIEKVLMVHSPAA